MATGNGPAFQFYGNDFRCATAAWKPEWVGVYVRLLCEQWDQGRIPDDMELIGYAAQVSPKQLADAWPVVGPKFPPAESGGGLQNRRLEETRQQQISYRERATRGGKKSRPRTKAEAKAEAKPEAEREANREAKAEAEREANREAKVEAEREANREAKAEVNGKQNGKQTGDKTGTKTEHSYLQPSPSSSTPASKPNGTAPRVGNSRAEGGGNGRPKDFQGEKETADRPMSPAERKRVIGRTIESCKLFVDETDPTPVVNRLEAVGIDPKRAWAACVQSRGKRSPPGFLVKILGDPNYQISDEAWDEAATEMRQFGYFRARA